MVSRNHPLPKRKWGFVLPINWGGSYHLFDRHVGANENGYDV